MSRESPRANPLVDLALVRLQLGDREEALAAGLQAMAAVERLEDLQSDTSHGARLLATRSGIYYVLADRLLDDGDDATREWLDGMVRNETKSYRDNTPLFEAILDGEIDLGLTNHYYLFRFLEGSDEDLPVRNYSPRGGGAGASARG